MPVVATQPTTTQVIQPLQDVVKVQVQATTPPTVAPTVPLPTDTKVEGSTSFFKKLSKPLKPKTKDKKQKDQ